MLSHACHALFVFAAGFVLAPNAAAQSVTNPDFSILAPEADPETEAAPALLLAGPQLDRDAYLANRGERSERALRTRWRVQRFSLDNVLQSEEVRTLIIGDGYVTEEGGEGRTLDFAVDRALRQVRTLDGQAMSNRPIAAHVHRQMDTFAFYTRGGQLEEVAAPDGTLFERFWIEAAMGVRLAPVEMHITSNEDGDTEVRRNEAGSVIFGFEPGTEGDSDDADLFRRWMRHTIPVHPDALNALSFQAGLPDSVTYLVFSPSSPLGRRETWTQISVDASATPFPWPADTGTADAPAYTMPDASLPAGLREDPGLASLIASGMAAAADPDGAPSEQDFLDQAEAAKNRADRSGAYLSLYHASNHWGPCTGQTTSPVCQRLSRATAAGLGDAQFDTVIAALSAMQDDRPAAISGLQPHFHRSDFAGATSTLLAAQALAALRASGSDAYPDLTPIGLFAKSATADPYAPLTYWHAGRYAASAGDVEIAWILFDLARSLPATDALPILGEAEVMRDQLRTIAPSYFGPSTTQ
jgi:hypothetical protein